MTIQAIINHLNSLMDKHGDHPVNVLCSGGHIAVNRTFEKPDLDEAIKQLVVDSNPDNPFKGGDFVCYGGLKFIFVRYSTDGETAFVMGGFGTINVETHNLSHWVE